MGMLMHACRDGGGSRAPVVSHTMHCTPVQADGRGEARDSHDIDSEHKLVVERETLAVGVCCGIQFPLWAIAQVVVPDDYQ